MTDRRRDPSYKALTAYIHVNLISRIKKVIKERGITQNEAVEQALLQWAAGDIPEPETIFDLVAHNLNTLKESGINQTNLAAIARGEVLPTGADFCKITSVLKIEEVEKRRLWEATYKMGNGNGSATNTKSPK